MDNSLVISIYRAQDFHDMNISCMYVYVVGPCAHKAGHCMESGKYRQSWKGSSPAVSAAQGNAVILIGCMDDQQTAKPLHNRKRFAGCTKLGCDWLHSADLCAPRSIVRARSSGQNCRGSRRRTSDLSDWNGRLAMAAKTTANFAYIRRWTR